MSKPLNVIPGESVEEFEALTASLQAEFKPSTETERMLVDMMISHEWGMRRAVRMQEQLNASLKRESGTETKRLQLIVGYYRMHERAFAQAKRQLEALRTHHRRTKKAEQRQWEQLLRKMPTLSNWIN